MYIQSWFMIHDMDVYTVLSSLGIIFYTSTRVRGWYTHYGYVWPSPSITNKQFGITPPTENNHQEWYLSIAHSQNNYPHTINSIVNPAMFTNFLQRCLDLEPSQRSPFSSEVAPSHCSAKRQMSAGFPSCNSPELLSSGTPWQPWGHAMTISQAK